MGHLGFSYIGLIFLLMLFIPNIIWTKNQPKGYSAKNENKILVIFERLGQVLVTCTALIFSDYNIHGTFFGNIILIIAFIFMIMYEIWWIRYFKSQKTLKDFYSSFLGVPVAGATLPVIAFFILSIYGKVIWLAISVIILGIGHIGIHLMHKKELHK
jgi:hypothetical protein